MLNRPRFLQRIYLINRDFQMRYVRLGVLVGLLSTILSLFLVLYPLFELRLLRFPNFLPPPFLVGIAVAAVLNFTLIAVFTVLITHRVAGPMFSLVRHMREVQAGRYGGEMRVRIHDEMKFVVRHFNELVETLRSQALQDSDKLLQARQDLQFGQIDAAQQQLEVLAQNLQERAGRIMLQKDASHD